ncbi:hypothetical protein GBAR_LOCUS420 [Geodia barretti]|uniref:Uncharacterized protein n=1 Tax=Geodia barretti TaxID=519541 RepID=A0AA35QSB4_GEOBA|nr:hypothetical protein GBAR_LOCUS420 [Geodia barretti]
MTQSTTAKRGRVSDKLREIGSCLELVPMDPHFSSVSVGLYYRDGICTVWSFSQVEGIEGRLRDIRDQMVRLGGVQPVEGSDNQFIFPCGVIHMRPVKFLLTQAVTKPPDFALPQGSMTIKDSKSALMLSVAGGRTDDGFAYQVSGEGEVRNPALRLRMVVAGFVRYGEMEKVGDTEVAFSCCWQHDELVRLLLPYSRNISAVESMLEAEATRGQMTTSTLGFTPL